MFFFIFLCFCLVDSCVQNVVQLRSFHQTTTINNYYCPQLGCFDDLDIPDCKQKICDMKGNAANYAATNYGNIIKRCCVKRCGSVENLDTTESQTPERMMLITMMGLM